MAKRKKAGPPATLTTPDRVLGMRELLQLIPLNRSSIYRLSRAGQFPAAIQLSTGRIGWRLSSVMAWVEDRQRNPVTARRYFGRVSPVLDHEESA